MKSLAVFVHNQDIDYKTNELLKRLDDCTDIADLHQLRNHYPQLVPPILESSLRRTANQAAVSTEVVSFDQNYYQDRKQVEDPLRLVLWLKFPTKLISNDIIVSDLLSLALKKLFKAGSAAGL